MSACFIFSAAVGIPNCIMAAKEGENLVTLLQLIQVAFAFVRVESSENKTK